MHTVLIVGFALVLLVFLFFFFYNNSFIYNSSIKDSISDIEFQMDVIESLIVSNNVLNTQARPIQSDLALDILAEQIGERISSAAAEIQDTRSSFAVVSFISGLAWWGVGFLFSTPFVAFYMYGVIRKSRDARFVAYAVLFLGIAGSIFGIGVLGSELVSDFTSEFGWLVIPAILGSSTATFVTIVLISNRENTPFYWVIIISVICVFVSFVIFFTALSVPEGCSSHLDLPCKANHIFMTVDVNRYFVSFSALLLAATLYLAGAAAATRKIWSES